MRNCGAGSSQTCASVIGAFNVTSIIMSVTADIEVPTRQLEDDGNSKMCGKSSAEFSFNSRKSSAEFSFNFDKSIAEFPFNSTRP